METFIKNLAKGAGKILKDGFGQRLRISKKSASWDLVTQYDFASDRFICSKIRARFPDHSILSEEGKNNTIGNNLWIIDPLDGTLNFSRGVPFFCICIAFVKNNEITHGAVYDPIHNELFYAEKGHAATLNNQIIRVNNVKSLKYALAATQTVPGTSSQKTRRKISEFVYNNQLWEASLNAGPHSLAYVAVGRFDYNILDGSHPWDFAGPSLIIKQAGGQVSDFNGLPYRWDSRSIIGANKILHAKIIKELKQLR